MGVQWESNGSPMGVQWIGSVGECKVLPKTTVTEGEDPDEWLTQTVNVLRTDCQDTTPEDFEDSEFLDASVCPCLLDDQHIVRNSFKPTLNEAVLLGES